jgi:hypothetical protein
MIIVRNCQDLNNGWMHMICLSIFGIIMILCSAYLFTHPSNYVDGTGTATDNSLCSITGKTNTCNTKITYVVNGKNYSGSITGATPYGKGITVNISYDPTNPLNVTDKQSPSWIIAGVLLAVGVCMIGGGYLNYNLTSTSKEYAAYQGAQTLLHL